MWVVQNPGGQVMPTGLMHREGGRWDQTGRTSQHGCPRDPNTGAPEVRTQWEMVDRECDVFKEN